MVDGCTASPSPDRKKTSKSRDISPFASRHSVVTAMTVITEPDEDPRENQDFVIHHFVPKKAKKQILKSKKA